MSRAETPGELPAHASRRVLAQRPPPLPPPVRRSGTRTALLAFTRQVLLRPIRIGTLGLFGGMTAVVLVGAEQWWIVLGLTLFHTAAGTLIIMWVDIPRIGSPRWAEFPRGGVVHGVPAPRRPGPGE